MPAHAASDLHDPARQDEDLVVEAVKKGQFEGLKIFAKILRPPIQKMLISRPSIRFIFSKS